MNNKKYKPCPICKSPAEMSNVRNIVSNFINCFRCGGFKITSEAYEDIGNYSDMQIANISGWIRENQGVLIMTDKFQYFKDLKTPTIGEKATKLLKYIANERPIPGQWIQIDYQSIYDVKTLEENTTYSEEVFEKLKKSLPFLSITWTHDSSELRYLIDDYLIKEQGFLSGDKRYQITPKGWAYFDSLKYRDVDSQMAFIAMWFDDKMKPLRECIKLAIQKSGYEPKLADEHEHVNRIDDEIIALIRQSKFIVADYTNQNKGVYFESGLALGLDLRVIWTCKKDEIDNLHFDTNHYNFLTWEEDKLPEFQEKLKNRILAVIERGTYNPES